MLDIVPQPYLKDDARIAIINRGEAAVRFIRAVKEYNALHGTQLKTVALYIDKEEEAPFVKLADDELALSSLTLFPGKQKSPYLDHELILEALEKTGAHAVWVGWGFVSEDAVFAEKVEKAGIIFMGPSSKAIALLGDKITAKDIAEKADVPILPWSRKSVDTLEEAEKISEKIGYPVIVKASNAGGGRGIRFVRTPDVLETQYNSAKEETVRITGNDIVFIELLVEKGRHMEVQCLSDYHGNVNTFGVRDCSVQRKNQKIIEETPPANFPKEIMDAMEASAARLIKAAGYAGAGTVEYLYDLNRNEFYFMEVNTRLQVEHPITETLYGIDLVKGQIDVARGNVVDLSHRKPDGHVIEVRLNAEDPERDFSPAPGLVNLFKTPAGPGIRVDSGIEEGSDIPPEFDSMIAKIISSGANREETMARLKRALQELKIRIHNGTTNRSFLLELLDNKDIIHGGVHTGYVEELLVDKEFKASEEKTKLALIAGAVECYFDLYKEELTNFKQQLRRSGRPRTIPKAQGYEVNLSAGGNGYTFHVYSVGNNTFHLDIDGETVCCQYTTNGSESTLTVNGKRHNVLMVPRGDKLQCEVDGFPVLLESDSGGYVNSPSPAIIFSTSVKVGDQVKKGDVLLVLEAMKMEMLVEAPTDGIVKEICVVDGEQVAAGQPLVQLDMEESDEEEEAGMPPVSFTSFCSENAFVRLMREFEAAFTGYDSRKDWQVLLDAILEASADNSDKATAAAELFITILDTYVKIESLFTTEEIRTENFSRAITYPELLTHYFRRDTDRDKGLPEEFISTLNNAVESYSISGLSEVEAHDLALFHIFKSHGQISNKEAYLKKVLFNLETRELTGELRDRAASLIDRLTKLTQNLSLVDAALNTRFVLVDKPKMRKQVEEQNDKLEAELKKLTASALSEEDQAALIQELTDAGPSVMYTLLEQFMAGDKPAKDLTLKIMGERLNRDRDITERGQEGNFYVVKTAEATNLVCALSTKELASFALPEELQKETPELIVLIKAEIDESRGEVIKKFISLHPTLNVKWLSVGVYKSPKRVTFKSYVSEGGWKEDETHNGFCPLHYRELKVYRLAGFDLETLYRSDLITLVQATSRENKKDLRLFALGCITETGLELDENGEIAHMVMFENVLTEAVFAMRSAQARFRYRLHWNRIIIHNRALMNLGHAQLNNYSMKFTDRIKDLGLEKTVIYTRRKRWSEDVIREFELNLDNVANDQYTLISRTPSDLPLTLRDKYATKVVTARQRNTVYPYEMVNMLTEKSPEFSKGGEFTEYDIVVKADGSQDVVDVSSRAAGENESNIVFGIISNTDNATGIEFKRVIIFSDSTTDMGSLAEGECRRINGAIDLARKFSLPVEWIPVSSGARINMESGTENLDWTAATLREIINFTQEGGEINIIVSGVNVGAQSYWNAEATMLMHTRGLLIMTDNASMLLTGKKALDFAGAVSGETNLDIGGVEKIMGPNGQAQVRVSNLAEAYKVLFDHYRYTYVPAGETFPPVLETEDSSDRDISDVEYNDILDQGFTKIGDIFSLEKNPERKKPFDIKQVMNAVIDTDTGYLERWGGLQDGDTSIVWETRIGGQAVGLIGIESRNILRIGEVPFDGPETWNGGTLFPQSSKKVARGINAFSGHLPLVIMANLSGFDGSPESLRRLQLEYGAEIGRAIVNFKGPVTFVVVARYHGGAYVVFSKSLNPNMKVAAIKGSYASVLGGAPAAAVVFPKQVMKEAHTDQRVLDMQEKLNKGECSKKEYDTLYQKVYNEKQTELGQKFDGVHSVQRAREVGSIDDIIDPKNLRSYIINSVQDGMNNTKM